MLLNHVPYWQLDEYEEHCCTYVGTDGETRVYEDEDGASGVSRPCWNRHAFVRWDGCVIYTEYSNGYEYDHEHDAACRNGSGCCEESLHICDLDTFVTMMTQLRDLTDAYRE